MTGWCALLTRFFCFCIVLVGYVLRTPSIDRLFLLVYGMSAPQTTAVYSRLSSSVSPSSISTELSRSEILTAVSSLEHSTDLTPSSPSVRHFDTEPQPPPPPPQPLLSSTAAITPSILAGSTQDSFEGTSKRSHFDSSKFHNSISTTTTMSGSPTKASNMVQVGIFVLLCAQNATLSLSMHYVKGVLQQPFDNSTAVFFMELVKFIICILVIKRHWFLGNGGSVDPRESDLIELAKDSHLMAVPAVIYFIQNLMQYVALANLDSATFTVMSQLKLLTAAVFSVILLSRKLSWRKWRALILLVVGVSLILLNDPAAQHKSSSSRHNFMLGLMSVGALISCSGFAGVYFEKVLKSSNISLWARNYQLAMYSMVAAILNIVLFKYEFVQDHGFTYGYTGWTWFVILLGSGGGLLVALVVKYTNTIVKGFATCISIVLNALASSYLFGKQLDSVFVLSVIAVIISLFNYSEKDTPDSAIVVSALKSTEMRDVEHGSAKRNLV
jgi:solute carrier family 35 (UDP-sugar transporter), member A1/2/3